MIGGEFDLSIGSMVAFTGLVFGALIVLGGLAAAARASRDAGLRGDSSARINGQIVIRTRLPSFIVTLAFLFILRGLSLVGLKWATGGSTQLRGIGDQAPATASCASSFPASPSRTCSRGSPRTTSSRKFPNGTADGARRAGLDHLVRRRSPRSRPGSSCARAPATGSSPPAATPTRRAIPACRSTAVKTGLFMLTACRRDPRRRPDRARCRLDRRAARLPEGVRGDHRRRHRRLPAHRRLRLGHRRLLRRHHLRHGLDRADLYALRFRTGSRSSSARMLLLAVLFNNFIRKKVTGER